MLDVRRLRLLRELKIRGTLADVASALNQSASSVSQQLAQLEREVGVELLRKSGRRVQLTPQAEILVEHTAAVLERLERAEAELDASLEAATGVIRLAVFQSAALALMPETLTLLAREHPGLRVEMTQREPETALYETWARDFDLVVAEQYPGHAAPHHPELDRVPLMTDALRLSVPPPGSAWGSVRSIAEASEAIWVMEPRGAASRHWAEQACRQAGFEPDVRFETADLQAQIGLIESGNAVALLPALLFATRATPPAGANPSAAPAGADPAAAPADANPAATPAAGRATTAQLRDLPAAPHRTIFTSARHASADRPAIRACREVLARVAATITDPV